jgi:hypothetical protein
VKKKVLITFVLGCVLLFSLAGSVYAYPPVVTDDAPPGQTFDDVWEVYYAKTVDMHWGPAVYYGEPVLIIYEGTGRDFFIDKKSYYQYKMQGSAKVYDEPIWDQDAQKWTLGPESELIDERPFSTVLKFKDPVFCQGFPLYCDPPVWPLFAPFPVEYFYVNWVIAGVYDFTATCKDGDWTVDIVAHTSPPTRGGIPCPVP